MASITRVQNINELSSLDMISRFKLIEFAWTFNLKCAVLDSTQLLDESLILPTSAKLGWKLEHANRFLSEKEGRYLFQIGNGEAFVELMWTKGNLTIAVMAATTEAGEKVAATAKKELTTPKDPQDPSVLVNYWYASTNGGAYTPRKIDTLSWSEIVGNYVEDTAKAVGPLLEYSPPFTGGKLILWHGDPGTGKTSAIRCLCDSWAKWCKPHYITDPEQFFNSASYILDVILKNAAREEDNEDDEYWDEEAHEFRLPALKKEVEQKWQLLIVEDADEFLTKDAKSKSGQGLSRLLAMADGLVGQGLNFLVLITTNAPLDNLHEAVSRPGRALAKIHFDKFPRAQAAQWLRERGGELPADSASELTLAQMYDVLRERKQLVKTDKELVHTGAYL